MVLSTVLFLPILVVGWLLIFLPLIGFVLATSGLLIWSVLKITGFIITNSRIFLRKFYMKLIDRPFFYPYIHNMTLFDKNLVACSCIGRSPKNRKKAAILTVHKDNKNYFKIRKYSSVAQNQSILKHQVNDARNLIQLREGSLVGWSRGVPLKCIICPIRSEAILERRSIS